MLSPSIVKQEIKLEPEEFISENETPSISTDVLLQVDSPDPAQVGTNNNKQDPSCGDENVGLEKKKSRIDTICFVRQVDDPQSVDIIIKYWKNFENLCAKNGFDLKVETDKKGFLEVRLVQTSPYCQSRKTFKEMEQLLKEKRNPPPKSVPVEEFKTDIKQEPAEVSPPEVRYPPENCTPPLNQAKVVKKKQQSAELPPIHNPNSVINRYIIEEKFPKPKEDPVPSLKEFDKFFRTNNLENFMAIDVIVCELSDALSSNLERPSCCPFYYCNTYLDRQVALLEYIKYLLTHKNGEGCTAVQKKIREQFYRCAHLFTFTPSFAMLIKKRDYLNNKFNINANIVGSVHFVPFKDSSGMPELLCLAIMDYRIVAFSTGYTASSALQKLDKALFDVNWNTCFKFVVNVLTLEKSFMYSTYGEYYSENEKVVMWINNNFSNLETIIYEFHVTAIPAIYNVIIRYARRESRKRSLNPTHQTSTNQTEVPFAISPPSRSSTCGIPMNKPLIRSTFYKESPIEQRSTKTICSKDSETSRRKRPISCFCCTENESPACSATTTTNQAKHRKFLTTAQNMIYYS